MRLLGFPFRRSLRATRTKRAAVRGLFPAHARQAKIGKFSQIEKQHWILRDLLAVR